MAVKLLLKDDEKQAASRSPTDKVTLRSLADKVYEVADHINASKRGELIRWCCVVGMIAEMNILLIILIIIHNMKG